MTIMLNIERNETEIEVAVELDYHPACRGERERGTGLKLSPDEDAFFEVTSATDKAGNEYELTRAEERQAEEIAFKKRNDRD